MCHRHAKVSDLSFTFCQDCLCGTMIRDATWICMSGVNEYLPPPANLMHQTGVSRHMLAGGLSLAQAVSSANVFPLAAALVPPASPAIASSPAPKVSFRGRHQYRILPTARHSWHACLHSAALCELLVCTCRKNASTRILVTLKALSCQCAIAFTGGAKPSNHHPQPKPIANPDPSAFTTCHCHARNQPEPSSYPQPRCAWYSCPVGQPKRVLVSGCGSTSCPRCAMHKHILQGPLLSFASAGNRPFDQHVMPCLVRRKF